MNPYLPLNEYVPDGEPHVFGNRVYIYGSHDKEGGETFCMLDYVCYSAPVDNLTDWRYEGIIYKASQDPDYNERPYMYAPDVVRGNDGKYYLYYCMSGEFGQGGYFGPIQVAVCDEPAGQYTYLGTVSYPDGRPLKDYVCFDPGVINDNGIIRIYYGTQYPFEEFDDFPENEEYIKQEMDMFGKSRQEILGQEDSVMGPVMAVLEDDMLTVKEAPKHIIPYKTKGTSFEAHPFFEASSIRKVGDKYYFIYSSMQNHELCYAISDKADGGFVFGGSIVSNGDIGIELNGNVNHPRLNMTGTTHGSIENINGEWYVFYHRLTHKSDYSRQGCAEKICIDANGNIAQVHITTEGLMKGHLKMEGSYSAGRACIVTNGHMPHGCNSIFTDHFPHMSHEGEIHPIKEICDNTLIGFRYFEAKEKCRIKLLVKASGQGIFTVCQNIGFDNDTSANVAANVGVNPKATKDTPARFVAEKIAGSVKVAPSDDYKEYLVECSFDQGIIPLYLLYNGTGEVTLSEISFE